MRYNRYSSEPRKPREDAETFWAKKEAVASEYEAGRDDVAALVREMETPVEAEKVVEV